MVKCIKGCHETRQSLHAWSMLTKLQTRYCCPIHYGRIPIPRPHIHMSACVIQGLESWITYNSDKIKRVQRRSARIVKSRYLRYSSVSDMLDVLGWTPLSQRRQEARLLFYKIINGLAQVPFEGVLVEAYKGTRRKHNMKFRHIGHTTSQYGQSFFPKTISTWNGLAFAEAPSLAVIRSNFI